MLRRIVGALGRARPRLRQHEEMGYDPSLPAPPRDRREQVWNLISPVLQDAGASLARERAPGGAVAVLASELPTVQRALTSIARGHPALKVRFYRAERQVNSLPAGAVTLADVESADWFKIGVARERSAYPVGAAGYLTVLVVDWDPRRRRYLARHTRARRVDWTAQFASARATRSVTIAPAASHPCSPIDVVYTWVDSHDPTWRAAHAEYSGEHRADNSSADNEERYIDRDELRYSLRSLWMFSSFINHIYIVTAGQRPSWLAEHPQISVVPHTDIFPSPAALPTFNSHAIESCLHRIPGLAENFLYFNDDVFLGREVDESDFFTLAGLSKVRMSPSAFIYEGRPERDAIPTDWAAYNSVGLVARDFSLTFDRRLQHVPLPLKRSLLDELEKRYTAEFERTRAARFRAPSDVAVPSMLAQYYAIATHRAVEWPHTTDDYVYLNTGRADAPRKYSTIMSRRPKFFCLNATRYDEIGLEDQDVQVTRFMQTVFPVASPWEKT
ncbi:MAG TPA: stealth conserved region 3 domain-containing protein [Micromonosporaceae bacterium]|nr:stealth conserved region 3 domain-containing protein [Micromonosporaceae bacterium]